MSTIQMEATAYKIIRGEQKTDEWQKLREGLITGSVAKQVKGTGDAFLFETLAMMTTKREPKELKGIAHVERGVELEPEARAAYEKKTKEKVDAGIAFIQRDRYGVSPDGAIYKKGGKDVKKLIEIKCPDTNNHIRYILENRIPSEHKDQIIHAFFVLEDLEEIDFVSYDPKFKFKPLHIINVKRASFALDIATSRVAYERFLVKLDKCYSTLIS